MSIYEILKEINLENGSKYKISVLEKHKDNKLLQRVLKMTYDKVEYTYGITLKNVKDQDGLPQDYIPLNESLDILENEFCTREVTGNRAIERLEEIFRLSHPKDKPIIKGIINRDLRLNISKKSINKVFKKLIREFPYMRCSLQDKINRIKYPAIVQEKCDGTYRSIVIDSGEISFFARSGEESNFPIFKEKLKNLPDGIYIGELLVQGMEEDRFGSNGLINSDTEPENLYAVCWDYLTLDEWKEGKSVTIYRKRFEKLQENIKGLTGIKLVYSKIVNDIDEAREFYKRIVSKGGEGAVLKNLDNKFKNGTATDNIKMKEEAVAEFIITDFQEGTGRLEGTLGAMNVKSADGKVVSKVSGFSDKMRDEIWSKRDSLLRTIVSVKYNGVSKAKNNDTYSLMFAQLDDLRPDKEEADTLEYIKEALK